ncbi:MAG: glycosyltransferase family 39 protein [Chloroflexi bacterium]|nr:glycosyltransferase family 39 protein [Chloroflexota bacterium]
MTKRQVLLEVLLIAAISLVAGFLRFYQLDAPSPGLHGDEATTGLEAMRVLAEGYIGPYVGSALGQPAGPAYWTALVFGLFGPSLFTLRLSMAILGALTIPVCYLLFRTMFNWRIAALGATLLAFSYWHLAFSRTGFMLISLPLVEALCLLFLFAALKRGNLFLFAVSGLLLGASIYTYNTAPLFILGAILFGLFLVVFKRYQITRRAVLTFSLAAFIGVSPMLLLIIQRPAFYFMHHGASFFFLDKQYAEAPDKLAFVSDNAVRSITLLFRSGGRDRVDGLGTTGLLDPVLGALAVGGLLMSLRRIKDERYFLILAGFITGLIGIIISTKGLGEYRRGISMLPFIALAGAVALDGLWGLVNRRFGVRATCAVVGGALVFVAVFNVNYYFRDWLPSDPTRWVYAYDLARASIYLKDLDNKNTYVYFLSDRWSYNYETRKFLAPDVPGEDRFGAFGKSKTIERDPAHSNVIYLILPPYDRLIPEIRSKYPDGDYVELREGGRLVFTAYRVK